MKDRRTSMSPKDKADLLSSFKQEVCVQAPGFRGNGQNDLTVPELRPPAGARSDPQLQQTAALVGENDTCPVEEHLKLHMETTRTCTSCGHASTRREGFSVGGSGCRRSTWSSGATVEATGPHRKPDLKTLPKVLLVHLKRFADSPSRTLTKLHDDIRLQKRIKLSSKQDAACVLCPVGTLRLRGGSPRRHAEWPLALLQRLQDHLDNWLACSAHTAGLSVSQASN
ncbi:uncharacterized protein LOC115387796 isoform X1 [Salarias fasciatus]|uniref:uncharacterized protein LOC115387796 isoform X1 n=1 Tax=Salarias fasciatus TaxID=181472 RepID=UPI001176FDF4|nr:uncharacterized protein LOC115387796 isoform X1 [Salarias fasciatus]XP_029946516.1 uncharacterized protein LOC115387796 isoform X1 [Salarias fasciatus]XP_029946517.1 uncharacterized protein LOC115387796 isoform X1 [Salarias fasciatus]